MMKLGSGLWNNGTGQCTIWMERHAFHHSHVNDDLLHKDSTWQENLRYNPVLYYLPSVVAKQLCALAQLRCTREADTS